jgi:hypothetical protein
VALGVLASATVILTGMALLLAALIYVSIKTNRHATQDFNAFFKKV